MQDSVGPLSGWDAIIKVNDLESTTFYGKRFTRNQLEIIQETVELFPHLSRRELGKTICEQIRWVNLRGDYKIQSCLAALEQMESCKLFRLPTKESKKNPGTQKAIQWTEKTEGHPAYNCELTEVLPVRVEVVDNQNDISLWNEYIDRYHYLRYRRPIGLSLRYFIRSEKTGGVLGCFLFSSSSVRALASRDAWIGWDKKQRAKKLNWVLTNTRFLIFPWVHIKGLASKSLSLVAQRLANDWEHAHNYRPVLLETFVDEQKYSGTCYRAANWQYIGKTSGRTWTDSSKRNELKPKSVFVYPLSETYQKELKQQLSTSKKQKSAKSRTKDSILTEQAETLSTEWQKITEVISTIATSTDPKWRKRNRAINTMLVMLFVIRLVFSKNTRGYTSPKTSEVYSASKAHI